jgi:hypothetical protein
MYLVLGKENPDTGSTMYKKLKLGGGQTYDHSAD